MDSYWTIENSETAEIKIKGSKFISTAFPAPNKEIALQSLEQIRAKHFAATHNCFAYQIGFDGNEFRYSDDGEPSGSSGKPIFMTIKKFEVSDLIVIVTRYFGGTKLGVGGLVRAYSDAAEEVLGKCQKKIVHRTQAVKINCRYEDISIIKKLVSEYAISFAEDYTDAVEIIANIPLSKVESFTKNINTATNARANGIVV